MLFEGQVDTAWAEPLDFVLWGHCGENPLLGCWLPWSLGVSKQELRGGGRGNKCSPAKKSPTYMENFSAFLIFCGNSCSLFAPTGKCWQLKGIVPPGPLGASVSGVLLRVTHLSLPSPSFGAWKACVLDLPGNVGFPHPLPHPEFQAVCGA